MMFKGLSVGWLKGVNQHRQVEWGRRGRLSYLTIALLFSVALTLSASQAQISTTRWTNPAGGDWHNPSNWDNGVPDANKQAVIDLPGTYTVRINSSATAAGLVLGNDDPSDTGTKTLTVSSTLTLNGDGVIKPRSVMVLTGTLTGSGKMQVEGLMEWRQYGKMEGQGETVVVSGGQMKVGSSGWAVYLRRKLTNEGSMVFEAGTLYLGQNGLLQNKGTFEVKDNTYISLTDNQPGLFVNEGTLRKGEGDGTAYVYAKVENKGTIEVLAGKISFGSSGHLVMMDGSQIKTNESGYLEIGGVIEAAEGATGKLAQGSRMVLIGLLTGSGKMQVEGLMEWRQSGKMEGQGETVVVSGGQMKVGSSGWAVYLRRKLTNEGSMVFEAGTLYLGQNGLLQNKGTFEVKDGTYISLTDNLTRQTIVNKGTFLKASGSGTANINVNFRNEGKVQIEAGTLRVNGDYYQPESGILEIGISGTQAGQFGNMVVGGAWLDGAFIATIAEDFTPPVNASWAVFTFSNKSGDFRSYDLPVGFVVDWLANQLSLKVVTDFAIASVQPANIPNTDTVQIAVKGIGFLPGTLVALKQGEMILEASNVVLESSKLLRAEFTMTGKPTGVYDVIVRRPDNRETKMSGAVWVYDVSWSDLTLTQGEISPTQDLVHGDDFIVRVTLKNLGKDALQPIEVRFVYGNQEVIKTVNGLRENGETMVHAQFVAKAGITSVRIIVDPNNRIAERDERNNETAVSMPTIGVPELEIIALELAPARPAEGDVVRVTAKVRNNGAPLKSGFTVAFYVDDTLIYNEPSPQPNLGRGEEMEVSQHFRYTRTQQVAKAIVDPNNAILETDETNNSLEIPIIPLGAAPDLLVTKITINPQQPQAGSWVTFSAEVKNQGDICSDIPVRFIVDGTPITTVTIPMLKAGATVTVTTVNSGWRAQIGSHTVTVVIDPEGKLAESNKDNNTSTIDFQIPSAEISLVTVEDLPLSPNLIVGPYPLTGQIPVRVQVRNNGGVGTGQFLVGLFADDRYLAGQSVSLAAYETKTVDIYVPLSSLVGKQNLKVKADVNNNIPETNENDNEKSINIPQFRLPDLEVTDITWSPQEFTVGQSVTFNITVKNSGQGGYGLIAWGGRQTRIPVRVSIGDRVIGEASIGVIQPGASETTRLTWTATPIDNPTVTVVADSQNWLPDPNRDNNTMSKTVPLRLESPDFVVSDIKVNPRSGLNVGDTVSVVATVSSSGQFQGLTDVRVNAFVNGSSIGSQTLSLRSGETKEVEFLWQAMPGVAHTFKVTLDKHPWETETGNNTMEATVPMEVAPVDLVVTDISDSLPSQLTESDSVTTRVTVRNQGSGAIRKPFQVALYVNNRWVNAVRLNGLEAGESKTVALTWTAFTAETITITAVADPDNQVPGEVDETNNGLSRQFNVRVVPSQQVRLSLSPITQKVAAGGQVNYQVQLNNSTNEPRRFRLQVVGLNGLQATISPDASLLNAWGWSQHSLQIQVPANAQSQTFNFKVQALAEDNSVAAEKEGVLEVTRNPQIFALLPESGATTGSTTVVFTWKTDVPASTEVFLRAVDEAEFRRFTGPEGTEHQVTVSNLQRGKQYRFYVRSANAQGSSQSEERVFTVTEAVVFTQREYRFTFDKDFDQRANLVIENRNSQPRQVQVELINPYEDVPANFIGAGIDQPLTLNPGQQATVTIAFHFQMATKNRYTFTAKVTSRAGEDVSVDTVPIYVTVDDQVDIEIQDLGTDPLTLQKTIRIVNKRNKPVAGLNLVLSDELKGLVALDQQLENFRLGPYESVTVRMQPIFAIPISRYPEIQSRLKPGRAVRLDIPEARQQLRQQRVGSISITNNAGYVYAKVGNVDFTPPSGKDLFAVTIKNAVLELPNKIASCTNQGNLNAKVTVPPNKPSDPFLMVRLSPGKGWSFDQIAPQTAYFYVNGHLVGKIENEVPKGLYTFGVPAEFIKRGDFPTENTITMQWYLPNGGHFLQVADVTLVIFAQEVIQYVVAENEDEALRIAQNQPFFERHDDEKLQKILKILKKSEYDAKGRDWTNPDILVQLFGPLAGAINNIKANYYSEYGDYACGGYQERVLEWLTTMANRYPELFDGIAFAPVEGFGVGHHAVAIWAPAAGQGMWDGYIIDPWYGQEMGYVPAWLWYFTMGYNADRDRLYEDQWDWEKGRPKNPKFFTTQNAVIPNLQDDPPPPHASRPRKQEILTNRSRQGNASTNPYLAPPPIYHFQILVGPEAGMMVTDEQGRRVGVEQGNGTINPVNDLGVFANLAPIPTPNGTYYYLGMLGSTLRKYTVRLVSLGAQKTNITLGWLDDKGNPHIVEYKDVEVASFGRQGSGQATLEVDPAGGTPILRDANGNAVYPDTSGQTMMANVQVGVTETQSGILPSGISMVALPLISPNNDIGALLEGGKVARWNPDKAGDNKYEFYPYPYASVAQRGAGYWVKLDRTTPVTVTVPRQEATPFAIQLRPGWNMVGNPYTEPIAWDLNAIKVRRNGQEVSLLQAWQQGWVEGYAWVWMKDLSNPFTGRYALLFDPTILPDVQGVLEPWTGCWIYAHQPCELVFPMPNAPTIAYRMQKVNAITRRQWAQEGGWVVQVRAHSGEGTSQVTIGVKPGRAYRISAPPDPPTGSPISLTLLRNGQPVAFDIREQVTQRQVWDLMVTWAGSGRGSGQEAITLTFDGLGYVPKDVSLFLVDEVTGKPVYLRTQHGYRFTPQPGETSRQFKLVAMLGNDRPLRVVGLKATPVRGQGVMIEFTLTKAAQVQAEVLTLTGRRVTVLESGTTRTAGTHRIMWRGVSSEEVAVSKGVYLVRMTATDDEGRQVQAVTTVRLK
jgi:subtilase family serine protease